MIRGLLPPLPSDAAHTLLTDPYRPQDYLAQSTVSSAVYTSHQDSSTSSYHNLAPKDTPLTDLISINNADNRYGAIRFCKTKHRIILPPSMLYKPNELKYRLKFYIDYLCITPKLPGFAALLPPKEVSAPFWDFILKLGQGQSMKPFKCKVRSILLSLVVLALTINV